jgi:hypothetical protein
MLQWLYWNVASKCFKHMLNMWNVLLLLVANFLDLCVAVGSCGSFRLVVQEVGGELRVGGRPRAGGREF